MKKQRNHTQTIKTITVLNLFLQAVETYYTPYKISQPTNVAIYIYNSYIKQYRDVYISKDPRPWSSKLQYKSRI